MRLHSDLHLVPTRNKSDIDSTTADDELKKKKKRKHKKSSSITLPSDAYSTHFKHKKSISVTDIPQHALLASPRSRDSSPRSNTSPRRFDKPSPRNAENGGRPVKSMSLDLPPREFGHSRTPSTEKTGPKSPTSESQRKMQGLPPVYPKKIMLSASALAKHNRQEEAAAAAGAPPAERPRQEEPNLKSRFEASSPTIKVEDTNVLEEKTKGRKARSTEKPIPPSPNSYEYLYILFAFVVIVLVAYFYQSSSRVSPY